VAREGRPARRDGNGKPDDIDLLASIAHGIAGNTICALDDAAAWPNARVPHEVPCGLRGSDRGLGQEEGVMRVLLLILTVLVTLGAIRAIRSAARRRRPHPRAGGQSDAAHQHHKRSPHGDKVESKDMGMALLFWASPRPPSVGAPVR